MAIQLTIVVDTDSLPSAPGSSPSNPATFGHNGAYMMTDIPHCAGGNGTADLQLKDAAVGDTLQVWGSSLSNQLLDEVFIYDFKHWQGDDVLDVNGMRPQTFNETALVPSPGGPTHNPPTFTSQPRAFSCTEIDVTQPGKEFFYVNFVVYGPTGAGGRTVKGYYQWDPSIQAF